MATATAAASDDDDKCVVCSVAVHMKNTLRASVS